MRRSSILHARNRQRTAIAEWRVGTLSGTRVSIRRSTKQPTWPRTMVMTYGTYPSLHQQNARNSSHACVVRSKNHIAASMPVGCIEPVHSRCNGILSGFRVQLPALLLAHALLVTYCPLHQARLVLSGRGLHVSSHFLRVWGLRGAVYSIQIVSRASPGVVESSGKAYVQQLQTLYKLGLLLRLNPRCQLTALNPNIMNAASCLGRIGGALSCTPARLPDTSHTDQAMNAKEQHNTAQSLLQYAVQVWVPRHWTCGLVTALDPVAVRFCCSACA